jgi:hypothetical protein
MSSSYRKRHIKIESSLNAMSQTACVPNFQKDVLSIPIPSNTPLDRSVREAQVDLDSGTPIEMARQKLINTGLSRDLVEQVIGQAAGFDRKRCPAETLTYRATAQRCAQCGSALEILPQV